MADLGGFFRTLNTDYLFAPSGEYALRKQVNGRQSELVEAQAARGQISGIELQVAIAAINQNTIDALPESERPTTVFVSEATKNVQELTTVKSQLDSLLRWPFKAIPPIAWVLLILFLLFYVELRTGILTGILKRKAS